MRNSDNEEWKSKCNRCGRDIPVRIGVCLNCITDNVNKK